MDTIKTILLLALLGFGLVVFGKFSGHLQKKF